jgi:outer membrane protein OmpA-like peptidoglycan-associated protein
MKTNIMMSLIVGFFVHNFAKANVIGTEYQNFNPDISGTDFTTVHSSEPVKQCMCNLGVFFNYAKNTYTYSDTFYATNTDLKGVRANDYLIGADVYAAFGITNDWDIGLALPFVVTAKNDDPYGVSYFDKFGLTEVRPMTKYRFMGDDNGGMALVFSANFNTIQDNPFAGVKPGPTLNIELAADTTTDSGLKIGGNIGFRKRNPGPQITQPSTGLPAPFIPFNDAFIFSGALAQNFESIKSTVIAELNSSISGRTNDDSAKKSQQAFEIGLGVRHEWSKDLNLHAGLGTKLADSQATPDIRAYGGINLAVGPVCRTSDSIAQEAVDETPTAVVKNHPVGTSSQTALDMPISALNPADYEAYRWKIGSTPQINCSDEKDYSSETVGDLPIITDIAEIPEGGVTLCAVAKNRAGLWQQFSDPTVVNWIKGKAPVAVVQNHPKGISDVIDLKMPVTAENPEDYSAYRWKIGASPEMNCNDEAGYSEEIMGERPIVTSIGEIPDSRITLCAVAKSNAGVWQPFKEPTIITWEKKKGYELFRLNASVLFDFDKDELQERSYDELEKISRHLNKKPFVKCIIEGHTDFIGTEEYNLDLSARRAVTVKKHMIKNYGFEADKFITKGMGKGFPLDPAQNDEAREKNRRVEFKIFRK